MLAILIGTVWLRLEDHAANIINFNGALFFTCAFMIFMSISVLPAYIEERSIFIRERANGGYSVAAYVIAHIIVEVPFLTLMAFAGSIPVYFLVNLNLDSAGHFFYFVLILFLSLIVAESIMVLISAAIPIFIVGIAAGAFTFGGFSECEARGKWL
jgi:ABC-type multidrug transport system permease subunit